VSTTAPIAAPPDADSYYARHQKVYPREVSGRFARLRTVAVVVLLGLYYLLPWLNWGDRQAVLFDLPARKFYLLGLVLWPQDFIFLTWLLVLAGLTLFFSTALGGRLWCGFACPQTVWTEIFVWMERLTEGTRTRQMKLDRGPWTVEKAARKTAKQALWIGFSLWTGLTFVGYFTPIRALLPAALHLQLGGWELFWSLFYGFATYGNAGYMREQVCKYMCPYARFQSAMFDRNTLVITYDVARGEPRGARARNVAAASLGQGDCVDCTMCVQVCPTGIDIRKGLQYECIACAACIDACDDVMDKLGSPRGLIRYTTQNALDGRPSRILRPRVLVYATLLMMVFGVGATGLVLRKPVALDVMRDRASLYRETADGDIENVYNLRIMNKTEKPQQVRLSVSGPGGVRLDPRQPTDFDVAAGEAYAVAVRVQAPASSAPGGRPIDFHLHLLGRGDVVVDERSRFIAP
jgi:cytochrome c oxidase accessory protein FixG